MTQRRFYREGFTLVEIMVALSLFLVVMTVAMGAVLSIFDANRHTQAESIVMNNLNLALEGLSRELRFGTAYHCADAGSLLSLTTPQNCPSGNTLISFLSSDGQQMVYRFSGTALERSSDGGSSFVAVTAPEIVLENVKFYVFGTGVGSPDTQPKVVMVVKGYSGEKANVRTEFSLETLVSERKLETQ